MENKSLKERFVSVATEYTEEFVKRHFVENEDGEPVLPEYLWVGEEVGGTLYVNDCYFSFDEIRTAIDEDIETDVLTDWYFYCSRLLTLDENIPVPNLKSWARGCPRLSEEELCQMEVEQRRIRRLQEDFRKEVDFLKGSLNRKNVYFNEVSEDANI